METKDEKMSKAKYNIVTLSAESLIDSYGKEKKEDGTTKYFYEFDFRNARKRRALIKSTEAFDDTALFYQIREVMREKGLTFDEGENALLRTLLYVDFEQLFNRITDTGEKGQLVKALIKNGFTIIYEDGSKDGKKITYQVFDKSNSMSRNSKISFVNSVVADDVSKRLNLDICFNNIQMIWSKYYAYRGLYLTAARRIVCSDLELSEATVVVVPDKAHTVKDQWVVTAKQKEGEEGVWKVFEEKRDITIGNVFDGEGLISPRYADLINEALGNKNKKASSFQVRMPFMKGMLHTVDFHTFIKEEGKIKEESFWITDAYGVKRDLMKAEIIVPVSMFKCYKWLKSYKEAAECMTYYFKKFREYKHALYIGNTDLIYGKSSFTRLSYQFLNTLALTAEEFDGLVQGHAEWANNPVKYIEELKEAEAEEIVLDDELPDEGVMCKKEEECWRYALYRNPVIAHEPGVKTRLEQLSNGLKLDMARGRFLVKGEVRFLSRDLLGFLIELLKNGEGSPEIEELKGKCLHNDKFFMPENQIGLEVKRHYPIFRSPHLSRNDQCALKPYYVGKDKRKKDIYYKYFGELRGILMVSYNSLVPETLGGADFDGDIVKVIDNASIRNAVLRGVYEKVDEKEKVKYQRKLPIVVIPTPPNQGGRHGVPKMIPYGVVKNTFSSKVGQISNLSIRIGNAEYAQSPGKVEHSCAECTILTGLEIDAAKTGKHPNLNELMDYAKSLESGFDYIRDFKGLIDSISKERYFIDGKSIEEANNRYHITTREDGREMQREYVFDEKLRGINRLPKHFFDAVKKGINLPGKMEGNRYIYFEFLRNKEEWKAWKKEKHVNELQGKVAAVISAYQKVARLDSKVNRMSTYLEKSNFEGHVKTILRCQYDAKLYRDILKHDLCMLWSYVDELLDTKQQAKNAIQDLEDYNWPFLLDDQKEQILMKVFGWDDQKEQISDNAESDESIKAIKKILMNFDFTGYNILYYTLKDVENMRSAESDIKELIEEIEGEEVNAEPAEEELKIDRRLYGETFQKLHKEFVRSREQKQSGIKKKMMEYCKGQISELLQGGSAEEKVKLLYSLRGNNQPDSGSRFFWECVTAEEIEAVKSTTNVKGE